MKEGEKKTFCRCHGGCGLPWDRDGKPTEAQRVLSILLHRGHPPGSWTPVPNQSKGVSAMAWAEQQWRGRGWTERGWWPRGWWKPSPWRLGDRQERVIDGRGRAARWPRSLHRRRRSRVVLDAEPEVEPLLACRSAVGGGVVQGIWWGGERRGRRRRGPGKKERGEENGID
jgi:hypothetical protein